MNETILNFYVLIVFSAVALDVTLHLIPYYRLYIHAFLGIPSRFARYVIRRLNRETRAATVLMARGLFTVLLLLTLFYGIGYWLEIYGRTSPYYIYCLTFLLHTALPVTALWSFTTASMDDAVGLKNQLIAMGVDEHFVKSEKDVHGIMRLRVEQMFVSYIHVVACVFYFLVPRFWGISGLAVLCAYVALHETVMLFYMRLAEDTPFKKPLFMAYEIVSFVPSRCGVVLIWLATLFTPSANMLKSIRCVFNEASKHKITSFGWAFAAVAGALDMALGGRNVDGGWIGNLNVTAKISRKSCIKAMILNVIAYVILLGILGIFLYNRLYQQAA